ncbi:hypothetical protein J6590_028768 [Homalodisca vitripennis]|nr:hypothetical protein J6590_028768 [Homalodisca vitripennis]
MFLEDKDSNPEVISRGEEKMNLIKFSVSVDDSVSHPILVSPVQQLQNRGTLVAGESSLATVYRELTNQRLSVVNSSIIQ